MSLINRVAVKNFALEWAASTRAQKFTRVGKTFTEAVEAQTRLAIIRLIAAHPSKGVTLK